MKFSLKIEGLNSNDFIISGQDVHLKVVELSEAIKLLPRAISLDLEDRAEELDLENIAPSTDNEIADVASRVKQRNAESSSPGWQ